MVEMFEVDEEAITLEARLLCEDLDLDLDFDIIDAVDMIIRLKEMTGKAAKTPRTR
jgi:acyl carrier protein